MTNEYSVEGKEKRTKNRSLWNTSCKWSGTGAVISDGDVLRPVDKVGCNEGEGSVRETKSGGES